MAFDLSAGDYDFAPAADNRLHITWRGDRGEDVSRVKVAIKVVGSVATVETSGPHNNMHYTIEVPKTTNLVVRLTAGDIRIGSIEGNKDIQIRAGDLRMVVGNDPDKYGQVDLSVNAGDINASLFGGSKDGLFRSFHWTGKGSYRVRAHLWAGDINLVASDSI